MAAIGRPLTAADASRVSLKGVPVDAVDGQGTTDLLRPLLGRGSLRHVITANVNYVREAAARSEVRDVFEGAAMVVPDGMPVVWAASLSARRPSRRVTGHDLVDALAGLSGSEGMKLFLLGGAPGVAERAAEELQRRYPAARIAGTYTPPMCPYPFPEDEDRTMVNAVNSSGADALVVALGCPKQDLWIASHRDDLRVSVAVGVGCVLDVLAGEVRRAPQWFQATGTEWVYRLYQEPRRLATRYLQDAAFLVPLLAGCAIDRLARRRRS